MVGLLTAIAVTPDAEAVRRVVRTAVRRCGSGAEALWRCDAAVRCEEMRRRCGSGVAHNSSQLPSIQVPTEQTSQNSRLILGDGS